MPILGPETEGEAQGQGNGNNQNNEEVPVVECFKYLKDVFSNERKMFYVSRGSHQVELVVVVFMLRDHNLLKEDAETCHRLPKP